MAVNPWQVESLDDFSFLCCPECVFRTKEEHSFEDHAMQMHPQSVTFFGENTSQYLDVNVKEEPIGESFTSKSYDKDHATDMSFENEKQQIVNNNHNQDI